VSLGEPQADGAALRGDWRGGPKTLPVALAP
jgi:hypothetical protein